MSGHPDVQVVRFRRACLAVAGGAIAFALACACSGREAEALVGQTPQLASSDMLELALSEGGSFEQPLPAWFSEELFALEGVQSYAHEDLGVFGFSRPGTLPAVAEEVISQMLDRGWIVAEGDSSACISFVKEQGRATWALVTLSEANGFTTVVVQVMVDA